MRRRPQGVDLARMVHVYQGDGVPDHHGNDRCMWCGLGQATRWHDLPETPADTMRVEARRLGEGEP